MLTRQEPDPYTADGGETILIALTRATQTKVNGTKKQAYKRTKTTETAPGKARPWLVLPFSLSHYKDESAYRIQTRVFDLLGNETQIALHVSLISRISS